MEKRSEEKQINLFLNMLSNKFRSGYNCMEQVTKQLVMELDESDSLITYGKPINRINEQRRSYWFSLQQKDSFCFSTFERDSDGDYTNIFFSPFIYRYTKRDQQTSRYLSALYVDIDRCTPETALKRLTQLPQELQHPTAIVSSGNGTHIYWVLGYKPKVSAYLKLWQRTMRELAIRLGGDTRVIDHARLMRLPGTWNQKRGEKKPCVLLQLNAEQTVELIDCAKYLGTYTKSTTTKQERPNTYNQKAISSRAPKRTYNYYLQQEILTLIKHRAFHGADVGYRNSFLVILRQLGASDTTLTYVNEELFSDPLTKSEVDAIKNYTWSPPKRSTLITTLQLTLDEEKKYHYLVNENLYEARKVMTQLSTRTLYSAMRRLLRLLNQKYSKKKQSLKTTASDLHISTKTASKYRKSRSKEREYLAVESLFLETAEKLNVIDQSLDSLKEKGWTDQDEQLLRNLQVSIRQLQQILKMSQPFQKKQLTAKEYHSLLSLIRFLRTLSQQFKERQLYLGGKEDGKK